MNSHRIWRLKNKIKEKNYSNQTENPHKKMFSPLQVKLGDLRKIIIMWFSKRKMFSFSIMEAKLSLPLKCETLLKKLLLMIKY